MESIAERLERVRERIRAACRAAGRTPDDVTLIAVAKGHPAEAVREAIAAGATDIGENRVQEAAAKKPLVGEAAGVRWHMIGHLQSNKVKAALGLFDTIHSVDSVHLGEAIAARASAVVPVFLEVNVAGEPSKSGFALSEVAAASERLSALPLLDVRGLMTVAPIVSSPRAVRPVFRRLREEAERLGLAELSMGMTDDFEAAIAEGATHVRIGRAIFGERA